MSKASITLSYKSLGAIALVIVNLIVVGPGGWVVGHLWNQAEAFRLETEQELKDLNDKMEQIRVEISSGYVTRQSFSGFREQMDEALRHLDNKIP